MDTNANEYDVIVIGAGAVGENVADRVVKAGLTAVVVEHELVGGECSYWACMPSKTLLRGAAALRAARDVAGASEAVTSGIDVAATLRRRNEIVHDWKDDSQVRWLDSAGIPLVRGHARLRAEREVAVLASDGTESLLTARHAVAVCTGSAAFVPDVPGLADAAPWTSREATSVKDVPSSIAILGAGVVGAEMATFFASAQSEVTMIARSGILGAMEPFVGEHVAASLTLLGVDIRTGVGVEKVDRGEDGRVVVSLDDGNEVRADEVLVATGRTPQTTDIGLETVGLEPGSWLEVDDTLRVPSTDWLYAVGDVNHRALLTHMGKYQARAAGDAIAARALGEDLDAAPWGRHVATADHSAVPQVVFTDPEAGSVGHTEQSARRAGLAVRVLDYNLASLGGAATYADSYRGHARAIVDEERGVIVGATFVGPDTAELVHSATTAIVGEVPIERLWHAVPSYPTLSEVWLRWLEEYGR
ncbi:dihydrolipoyl dehydrogenase family protein [Microbacterium koreense]|uniref:Dihydrolipoyl dehydrogenase family protein n=1 Tax=Microbacterium koreense TaxID=323761 RepID=A0ABW2ZQP9_9MICO